MAKVLGFNPQQSYIEMEATITLQRSLIEELIKLNDGYEAEVKRLVGEYDKIYELYLMGEQLLKNYDARKFGYPTPPSIEFIDFSKNKQNG
jgi:hypothetical protein